MLSLGSSGSVGGSSAGCDEAADDHDAAGDLGLGFEVRVWGLVVMVRMSRAQDRLPLQEHQGKGGLGF